MEIEVTEEDYNWKEYTASLDDRTNKWYANWNISLRWWWNTPIVAKENLIEKAKELIEELNSVIYK